MHKAGEQVLPAVNDFWGYTKVILSGGRTYFDGGLTYNVGFDGKIIGIAPMAGMPPSVGLTKAFDVKSLRTILNSWKNISFKSIGSTIRYHLSKHGNGVNLSQYTDDALNFFKNNVESGKNILLKDGSTGLKITTPGGGPGGIFTLDGKIVSFWYK